MVEVELLGARSTTRAATMALSPHHQLLAAGTAARPHAGWDGGNSRIDILGLWEMDDEPERGRQLEVVATIPAPSNRAFHRLAWSASDASNSVYPYGLLAGALDDGVVYVWDPYKLDYAFSCCYFGVPKRSHTSIGGGNQYQIKEVEEAALERQSEFDNLLKEDFIEHSLRGFTLESKVNRDDVEDWVLLEKPNRTDNCGLVLKLNDISGKVFAISFNHQHKNVLACGGDSEKLKLYHLDHPIKSYELADVESSSRTTFLDWHPQYPVAIASTCDAATAKIWDLRVKKPTHSINQKNKHCTEIHWNANHPVEFVVGSVGDDTTVKIWDLRNTYRPLSDFGPKKGVVSLSWCRNPNVIITTAVDGGVDCWKLNVIEGSEPSRSLYLPPERRSLPLGEKEETAWFDDNVIVASSALNIGLYKLKSPW